MTKRFLSIILFVIMIYDCKPTTPDPVDYLFKAYQSDNPGAAVMVIQNGKVLLERYYGLADIENKIAVDRFTNFRLASVSKEFTAMSILQLMQAGKLSFNTALMDIFPEFPTWAEAINYGHLLHHTSGLLNYESLIPDTATIPVLDADVLNLLLKQDRTYFEPGSSYNYNNGGYAVLALSVERLSGMTFPQYLKQNLFDPIGMNNSVAFTKGVNVIPHRAYGYNVIDNQIEFSDQNMTSSVLGDGGIYSSVNDMFKWDQALYGHEVLPQTALDSAFTPWLEKYGCGWRIEDYRGLKRISHTGSSCGFRTDYQRFPDFEFSVIILTNRREPGVQYLAEALTDMFLLKDSE